MTQAAKFVERLVACGLVLGGLVLGGLAGGASAAAQDALRLPTSAGDEPPMVSSISFRSYPEVNGTCERGETVEVAVEFTRSVVVSPSVRLALAIGRQTRFADYSPRYDIPQCPPCGFQTQYFRYIVGTGDRTPTESAFRPMRFASATGSSWRLSTGLPTRS